MSTDDIKKESRDIKNKEEEQQSTTSTAETRQGNEEKVVVVKPTYETEYKNSDIQSSNEEKEEQQRHQSVSAKAKEAGQSLKEMVKSLGKKAKSVTGETAQQIKDKADVASISSKKDSRYIQALGENVEKVVTVFEDTMTEIGNEEEYDEQERLLTGYKKLLEEQINVIDSRLKMVKRLKNIA
jgi:hypothetical protein